MFTVVYDAQPEGLWYAKDLWLLGLWPCVAIVCGFMLFRRLRRAVGPRLGDRWPFVGVAVLALSALALWPLKAARQEVMANRTFLAKLHAGEFSVVEGVVSDFVAQDSSGHPIEHFRVGTHAYDISRFTLAPGYHTARWEGGVIGPNLYVRLADIDGRIARVEVRN